MKECKRHYDQLYIGIIRVGCLRLDVESFRWTGVSDYVLNPLIVSPGPLFIPPGSTSSLFSNPHMKIVIEQFQMKI